jgi:hypothetical protein
MPEEAVKSFGSQTPMRRPGQPAEFATAYVMLADPLSSYVRPRRSPPPAASPSSEPKMALQHPVTTPDGRYLVVKGRLWRLANPNLPEGEKSSLVSGLMRARAVKTTPSGSSGSPRCRRRQARTWRTRSHLVDEQ